MNHNVISGFIPAAMLWEIDVAVSVEQSSLPLSIEYVRPAVEARLRAARLYAGPVARSPYSLVVDIQVVSSAWQIRLDFTRWVGWPGVGGHYQELAEWWDQKYPKGRPVPAASVSTWSHMSMGTHTGDSAAAAFILSSVSQLTDIFLVDYLHMNEEACA